MPSYMLEATHLSRTGKRTALKCQIPIFSLSPVNFFLFPFLAHFRLQDFLRYWIEN